MEKGKVLPEVKYKRKNKAFIGSNMYIK